MSAFVLDCSVAMAWYFEDEADALADAALERLAEEGALVPSLWSLEVVNVLLAAERARRITASDSARFLELIGDLPITVLETPFKRAAAQVVALGREHGLSAYDAAYLDLAMREGLPLASRDTTLCRAATACGVPLFHGEEAI